MAFKLTKTQAKTLDSLIGAYGTAREALAEALDAIATDWEETIGDKSEKWQESEAGKEAQERADTIRAWFDELPEEPGFDLESLS